MKILNRNFLIIVLLAISAFVAIDLYMPSFPSMVHQYHSTANMIELSLTLFLAGFTISQLIFGILSDRFGRKSMIIIGISIYLAGSIIMLIRPSLSLLLIGRSLQGLGIGAAAVLSRSITRDLYSGKQLAQFFSIVAISIILAPTLAPVVGGFIQHNIGYKGNYIFMLLYGITLLAISYYLLPETNTQKNSHATEKSYLKNRFHKLLTHKDFMLSCATNGFSFSLVIIYSTVNPFIVQNGFGYNAQEYGLITLIIASGMILGMFLNTILVRNISGESIVAFGQGIIFVATLSLLLISFSIHNSVLPLITLLFIMNIGISFTLPNMAAKIFSFFDGSVGFVGAIYGSLRMLISTLVGIFVVALHIKHIENLAIILLLTSLAAIASFTLPHYKKIKNNQTNAIPVRNAWKQPL